VKDSNTTEVRRYQGAVRGGCGIMPTGREYVLALYVEVALMEYTLDLTGSNLSKFPSRALPYFSCRAVIYRLRRSFEACQRLIVLVISLSPPFRFETCLWRYSRS